LELALGGGDDYELCFTVPTAGRGSISVLEEELALPLTWIGEVTPSGACHVRRNGKILTELVAGYRHTWSG
jgi:thiamine-monophosphate kinase